MTINLVGTKHTMKRGSLQINPRKYFNVNIPSQGIIATKKFLYKIDPS